MHVNGSLTIASHPLLKVHLTRIRGRETSPENFRHQIHAAARILALECSRDFNLSPISVTTPLETTTGYAPDREVVLVPVLRAGLGLLQGFLEILPWASVGHLGLRRDEVTLEPETYYSRLPDKLSEADVLLLDPMLATGGSAVSALDSLKRAGASRIRFCSLLAAPEGIEEVQKHHPDVDLVTACIDRGLNANGYILPGIGDAGDRYFDTL